MKNIVDFLNENAGYAIIPASKQTESDSYCVVTLAKTSRVYVDGRLVSVKGGVPTKLYPVHKLDMDKARKHIIEFDGSHLDVSGFTSFDKMFSGCVQLKNIDLSGWDTSNVTTVFCMFSGCKNIESIDLSGWDTHNLTDMCNFVYACSNLKELNLDGWDTSNVQDLTGSFWYCTQLRDKSLAHTLKFSKVKKWGSAFKGTPAFDSYPGAPAEAYQ